jgi:hypothetical protein
MSLTNYLSWFKESLSLFSSSVIKKWIIVFIPFCAFFMLWIGSGGFGLDSLFAVTGSLGWSFVTGIPFVLGAMFLFGSQKSQTNIADAYRADNKDRFTSLFVTYTILVLILMVLAAIVGFVLIIPRISADLLLTSFPSLLISTMVVSLFLCPIAVFLVLIFDDRRMSLGLGTLLFIAIAYATGFPRIPVSYPEVAFLGPTHLHTALVFLLCGGFEFTLAVEWYVGITFTPSQLIIPLAVFIVLSLIFYMGSRFAFKTRLRHWVIERELLMARDGESDLWTSSGKKMSEEAQANLVNELSNIKKKLMDQRKVAAAILLSAVILIPVVGTSYVSSQREDLTTVVYEASSVQMEIGVTWLYGEFRGNDPPENVYFGLGIVGEIAGGHGGSVRYNFGFEEMPLTEYLQLNETEHSAIFASGESGQYGLPGTTFGGGGLTGPISDEIYVWALRFLEVGGETEGVINVSFQVYISPVP